MTCIILHNLQNTNLQTLLENPVLCNFQMKACLAQQSKPRKLIYYVINHQSFRAAYIILWNLQNINSQILHIIENKSIPGKIY